MQKIINAIINSLGGKLGDFLIMCVRFAESTISIISKILDQKEKKEKKKQHQEIKDICDSGTLDELLHKFNRCTVITAMLLFAGCTGVAKVDVMTTNPWEGHFNDETSFK